MLLKHDRCALVESQLAKRSTKHHKASDQSLRVSGHKHPEQFLRKANRHCFLFSVFTQLKSARNVLFILLISIKLTCESSDWLFTAECVGTCCVINLSVISFSLSLCISLLVVIWNTRHLWTPCWRINFSMEGKPFCCGWKDHHLFTESSA